MEGSRFEAISWTRNSSVFKLRLPDEYLAGPVFICLLLVVEFYLLNQLTMNYMRFTLFSKDFMRSKNIVQYSTPVKLESPRP